MKLELVTMTRRFVRQGNLVLVEKNETSPQHIILFNDLLLITKQKVNTKTGKLSYELRAQVPLPEATVVVVADTPELKHAFETIVGKKTWKFGASNEAEQSLWIKEIKACKKDIQRRQYEEQYGSRGSVEENKTLLKSSSGRLMSSAPLQPAERERHQHELNERKRLEEAKKTEEERKRQEEVKKIEEENRRRKEFEERSQLHALRKQQLLDGSMSREIEAEFDDLASRISRPPRKQDPLDSLMEELQRHN